MRKEFETEEGLFSDLKKFLQDDSFKDFKIQIEDREFHVHKFVLVARSKTLSEIIKNNPEAEKLNLLDMSVNIFEIILKYLYTAEVPCDDEFDSLRLFAAAGRLRIEQLKNFAAMKILEKINGENAFEILKLCNTYEQRELRQKAFDMIKKKYPRITFEDEWIAEPESVRKIVEKFKEKEEVIRRHEEAIEKLEEEFTNAKIY